MSSRNGVTTVTTVRTQTTRNTQRLSQRVTLPSAGEAPSSLSARPAKSERADLTAMAEATPDCRADSRNCPEVGASSQRLTRVVALERLSADQGFDSRFDFAELEGLAQVVVGAQFKGAGAVGLVALGGEHQHGQLGVAPERLQEGPTIHHRHAHVQHDHLGRAALDGLQRLEAVLSLARLEAVR